MEDKQAICTALVEVLRLTRFGTNIDRIHYQKVGNGLEIVTVVEKFHGATEALTKIDVTADSSAAMINAIINKLSN